MPTKRVGPPTWYRWHKRGTPSGGPGYDLFGLHEPGGEHLMIDQGVKGHLLFTHALGHHPENVQGLYYTPWALQGLKVLARLNHGYGRQGTIPLPDLYAKFAECVAVHVRQSPGCTTWIIGNEPNHQEQESPEGRPISPASYALCFRLCRQAIKALPGHKTDQVVMAPVAPYYPPKPWGYLLYFRQMVSMCETDGIALHAYSRGPQAEAIGRDLLVEDGIYKGLQWGFRTYRDFLAQVPPDMQGLPVWITETNQYQAWADERSGWPQAAYREIRAWNDTPGTQKVRALILYRWPRIDPWYIEGKHNLIADFVQAMRERP